MIRYDPGFESEPVAGWCDYNTHQIQSGNPSAFNVHSYNPSIKGLRCRRTFARSVAFDVLDWNGKRPNHRTNTHMEYHNSHLQQSLEVLSTSLLLCLQSEVQLNSNLHHPGLGHVIREAGVVCVCVWVRDQSKHYSIFTLVQDSRSNVKWFVVDHMGLFLMYFVGKNIKYIFFISLYLPRIYTEFVFMYFLNGSFLINFPYSNTSVSLILYLTKCK